MSLQQQIWDEYKPLFNSLYGDTDVPITDCEDIQRLIKAEINMRNALTIGKYYGDNDKYVLVDYHVPHPTTKGATEVWYLQSLGEDLGEDGYDGCEFTQFLEEAKIFDTFENAVAVLNDCGYYQLSARQLDNIYSDTDN